MAEMCCPRGEREKKMTHAAPFKTMGGSLAFNSGCIEKSLDCGVNLGSDADFNSRETPCCGKNGLCDHKCRS